MNRVQFIEHQGKRILHLDFSKCKASELGATVEEAKAVINGQPSNSLLILTDVTDTEMSRDTSRLVKDFTAHNKPYVAASAVVGVSGLKKIIYDAVLGFSGRQIATFTSIEQAKDWLAGRQT